VNCFQIVSLRYWWHHWCLQENSPSGCELLSDCIFEVLVTPRQNIIPYQRGCELLSDCIFEVLVTPNPEFLGWMDRLWIAFRLYLWGIGDTLEVITFFISSVVNCFQIVSLRYWWHQIIAGQSYSVSCELLSDCIFEVLVTPFMPNSICFYRCELLSDCIFEVLVTPEEGKHVAKHVLWIAFRLYLWGIGDTLPSSKARPALSCELLSDCIFEVLVTPGKGRSWGQRSCELLSDCIFEVLVTPGKRQIDCKLLLWIAFRLYLWGIGDTRGKIAEEIVSVVNCFQIVSLRYWWHRRDTSISSSICCELLSDCIFEVLVTPWQA